MKRSPNSAIVRAEQTGGERPAEFIVNHFVTYLGSGVASAFSVFDETPSRPTKIRPRLKPVQIGGLAGDMIAVGGDLKAAMVNIFDGATPDEQSKLWRACERANRRLRTSHRLIAHNERIVSTNFIVSSEHSIRRVGIRIIPE